MNVRGNNSSRCRTALVNPLCYLWMVIVLLGPPNPAEVLAQSVGKQRREAQKAIRVGDYDKAEKIYRKLLSEKHNDNQTRLDLSYTLIKNGRLEEAYQSAALVAGQDPMNARAHALLGLALLRSGIFQQCVQEFNTAMLLDRRDPVALAGRAEVDFFENRAADSYEKLRLATSIDPNEPDYWIAFGRTAARLERFKEAAEYYDRFLVVSPKLDEEKRARYRGLIDFYYALARSSVADLHRVEGPKALTVPFEMQNSRPYVRIKVNGGELLSFVVDTGASITVMAEPVADRLSIRPMARGGRARAVGGGGTFPIVYGLVNQIEIGDIKIYNVPIYIRQLHHFRPQEGDNYLVPDGFLGLSVLSNFRVTLDYARRQLLLENENASGAAPFEAAPAEVSVVPFRTTNGGLVSAEARLGGEETFNFLVDSGASSTVLSDNVIEKMKWHDKLLPDLKVRILGAAGVIEDVDLLVIPSFTINDLEQRNIRMPVLSMNAVNETAGFLQSGIIGGSFLKHFRVTFDFQRFRLLLLPQTEAVRKLAPESEPHPQVKEGEN
ncbi:MAG: aspartyl protease family protein [Acidobacteria bacterium]|nr:aspartyl protease family protein [Acidobacteriota bacterium]